MQGYKQAKYIPNDYISRYVYISNYILVQDSPNITQNLQQNLLARSFISVKFSVKYRV